MASRRPATSFPRFGTSPRKRPAGRTHTTFEYLRWDGIVRRHWLEKGRIALQLAAVRVLWIYHRTGVMKLAKREAWGAYMALLVIGLAPFAFALMTLLVTLIAGALGSCAAGRLGFPPAQGWWLALPAFAVALLGWDWAWRGLNLEWLARGFACVVETARREKPTWEDRCQEFAERMAAVDREGGVDEIVLVGHSLGGTLAATTLRRLLTLRESESLVGTKIAFATLGQIIPFSALIESDGRLLRDVRAVAASPDVDWVNVTSGADPGSAGRLSPLTGVEGADVLAVPRWDPEFHRILTRERYVHIHRRPLKFHFQYLRSADRSDGFDLIRMMNAPNPFLANAPR